MEYEEWQFVQEYPNVLPPCAVFIYANSWGDYSWSACVLAYEVDGTFFIREGEWFDDLEPEEIVGQDELLERLIDFEMNNA